MKKLFTALLIFSFIFYQVPAFAVDETAPDISQSSPEIPPEDESEETAPPSGEEEPPPEEGDPENPEDNPGESDPPEGDVPPEGEPGEGEETPPETPVDLSEITGLMEQNFLSMYDELSTIRKNLDIIIYFVIPVLCAVLVVYKVIAWFYSTFIEDAL